MIGFSLDITARKKAEEEGERLTQELRRANQELETVIRIASHDLRSPLVNIQGFSMLLNKACDEMSRILTAATLPEATREAILAPFEKIGKSLRFINAGVDKMNSLISGLLRLSQLGRASLQIQPVDMNALLKNVVEALTFQIRAAGADVAVDVLPACQGDAAQISQVFSNLLDNAIKYCTGIRPPQIRIWGRREAARLVYCVEDNGIGVAPEHQQRIWHIFYRLNPRGNVAGEGLGLTAVQLIVERHGGSVWMESEIDKGSRFYLALPLPPEETLS